MDFRKAREELASYAPWGRAGGGAPNIQGVRFSDIRAAGIYPDDELKGVSLHESCQRWSSPQRSRRGPLRLREDPQLCYAEILRRSVDNDIRYRQTQEQQQAYKQMLDDIVNERRKVIKDEIKKNLEYERKMLSMEGPWGRPGPGGTIWRNPRDVGLDFSKSMGWTNNEMFNDIKRDQRLLKRSSLTLPNVKTADDYKLTHKKRSDKLPTINLSKRSPGERKIEREKELAQCYGKKKKQKFLKKLPNGELLRKLDPDMDKKEEEKLTPDEAILRLTGGIELVPLLARRRRVGARTLPSSDVTRPPEEKCQWREIMTGDYLSQLKQQMRVKILQKEENRRNSAESVKQHHATWTSLWGRPGHGAPQQRGRYARSNLAQLLYTAPFHDYIENV